jgi:HEAT repeat protein
LTRTLPVLVAKLKDADLAVRRIAISSFSRAGERGREHIPILLELMCGNPAPSDFMAIHHELKALGAGEEVETPCLIHALDSTDVAVRNQAISLLSLQGRTALSALPRLRQMMEHTADKTERQQLLDAVARIESPEKVALAEATNLPPRPASRRGR